MLSDRNRNHCPTEPGMLSDRNWNRCPTEPGIRTGAHFESSPELAGQIRSQFEPQGVHLLEVEAGRQPDAVIADPQVDLAAALLRVKGHPHFPRAS